ncbi:HAMP domain-containing sensor histidine kinase [Ekhidna sp.]|uniref:PAS domain-containing sensor histidine kinase n=2 Tax=Ekhidna sp. TaxID=2608089 RepID=UPI003298CE6D
MKIPFSKLAYVGTEKLGDPLSFQRVFFINILSLLGVTISLIDSVLLFFENLYLQSGVTFTCFLLYTLILFLNKKGRYQIAGGLFLLFSLLALLMVTVVAYEEGRFNETENVIIALMTVSYLLLQDRLKVIGYWFGFVILIGFKFLKQQYLGGTLDFTFWLTLQNISILCLILFFTIDAFRKSLMKAMFNLQEKDEVLYSMIDNVPLFIGLIDKDLRYKMVNVNYEKAFGIKREDIIGSHLKDVLAPNLLEMQLPLAEKALGGEIQEFLELAEMPDGSSFYAGGKYIPITSDQGEVVGAAVFVNDVTKLESAKKKLEEANKTKDRLFSIVSHDIRGPLDLFEGLLNVSSDGTISQTDFLKHQESVRRKLGGLKETVNTLLDWARTQLDGINANPSLVNVGKIVSSNSILYEDLIKRKNIQLKVEVPEGLEVWIDENHFKIATRNMIHNALKFTPEGGQVTTSVVKVEDHISMKIKDNGVGMDLDKIHSIMKKELQNSRSGTSGEMGTGLGLSLSLALLEKNNCDVEINSAPNRGTEIKISIPLQLKSK